MYYKVIRNKLTNEQKEVPYDEKLPRYWEQIGKMPFKRKEIKAVEVVEKPVEVAEEKPTEEITLEDMKAALKEAGVKSVHLMKEDTIIEKYNDL